MTDLLSLERAFRVRAQVVVENSKSSNSNAPSPLAEKVAEAWLEAADAVAKVIATEGANR